MRSPLVSVQLTACVTMRVGVRLLGELRAELIVEATVVGLERCAAVAEEVIRNAQARHHVGAEVEDIGSRETALANKGSRRAGLAPADRH